MDLCTELKQLREQKNMSVYRLSKLTDISENHIHNIEIGASQPSVATLERILTALGSNLAEFFNQDPNVLYPTELEHEFIQELRSLNDSQIKALLTLIKTIK